MDGAAKYKWSNYETKKTLQVFGWSLASALVTLAIGLLASADIPVEYALYIPAVNSVLYALKQFIADNQV